jgi:anti-sigma factor RsiW
MKSSIDSNHLSQDMILRMSDDELTASARLECESHLAVCEVCRQELASLHEFSAEIELAVQSTPIPALDTLRSEIQERIQSSSHPSPVLQHPGKIMLRFGWGMGIAATLAFGILVAPRQGVNPDLGAAHARLVSPPVQTTFIEVDGETFAPVPYSNADLSTAAPHIVQMQVPVSSLADIGIPFESVTSRSAAGSETDRSVLADVLVGADGQPRGVHVLGFE